MRKRYLLIPALNDEFLVRNQALHEHKIIVQSESLPIRIIELKTTMWQMPSLNPTRDGPRRKESRHLQTLPLCITTK